MNKQGFTLVEVLVAIVIIGIAFVSLIAANNSCTTTNGYGVELSTSEFLIEQIRELTRLLPVFDPDSGTTLDRWTTFGPEEAVLVNYDDLDDFDGAVFSPPINSERASLSDFSAFSQQVAVENVSASNFQTVVADGTTAFVRVTVTIFLNSERVSSASWIRATY